MFEQRRLQRGDASNGYVETDPTGRYGRFNEVLGKGATKTVYKAFDEQRGMEMAWNQAKLNDVFRSPEELERLYSEVHLLKALNHESIIQYFASWIDPHSRTINFITEMFTSGTLREYRQKYKRVDIRAVKNWARQILRGLVYLHSHDPPVIHRDLKCDNIFVNGHLGRVKIGDLGLAAILRGSQAAHSVIGTPEFMAPELYEEEYNELVDVYSFGMCVLEMLTSEYPYSECSNPAQIYKKVTSGKKPEAFYRIQDPEGQLFVGKCLEIVSKRLSAKELLLDPFLRFKDECQPKEEDLTFRNSDIKTGMVDGPPVVHVDDQNPAGGTDMTITGNRNPDDDTIFLQVQIADKDGRVRNIHFPFDIITDTPIDVATEMVKELEITDRDAMEIAEVIDDEISALVPHWKDWNTHQEQDDYPDEDDGPHPFRASSSCSSSQVSLLGFLPEHSLPADEFDWLQDKWIEEGSSPSSIYSGYYNSDDPDFSPAPAAAAARESNQQAFINTTPKSSSSRFCPETRRNGHTASVRNRRLTKNNSYVDVQRQLHQLSMMEEVRRLRLFKTVGAVENIGFQAPLGSAGRVWSPASTSRTPAPFGYDKKHGYTWGKC